MSAVVVAGSVTQSRGVPSKRPLCNACTLSELHQVCSDGGIIYLTTLTLYNPVVTELQRTLQGSKL